MIKKRIKMKCWSCERNYTLLKELDVDEHPRLVVECPFCEQEGVVDLAPYRSEIIALYRSQEGEAGAVGETLDLPDVFPTTKREE